jgi:hypothetical protein
MTARRLFLAACLLPLAACGSSSLGRVPEEVIELYDLALPSGVMELEIDRDGRLLELEVDVPLESVPEPLIRKIYELHPQALLRGAEREINRHGRMWEIKFLSMGRTYELVFDEQGEIHESEMSLAWSEAPPAVLEGARLAIPGSAPVSVELVEGRGGKSYHVKAERDGARYKVVLDEQGKVLRRVREHRAEIEIPLRD